MPFALCPDPYKIHDSRPQSFCSDRFPATRMTLIKLIKALAQEEKIAFKKHGLLRMHKRKIKADDVKEVLVEGEIIEEYPEDKPLPSCLILGYNNHHRPIHVVLAVDAIDGMLWVITVYEPKVEEWEEGFRTRRKR